MKMSMYNACTITTACMCFNWFERFTAKYLFISVCISMYGEIHAYNNLLRPATNLFIGSCAAILNVLCGTSGLLFQVSFIHFEDRL